MANPVSLHKTQGRYLWCSLLSLGFQPEAEISNLVGKTTVTHINLGTNMFDKPNKDAFYIVTHFLLDKLNPARFNEAYRHCWPVFDRKADAEFRKITFAWIKDIIDEHSSSAPKVVASLFLSPGGPKFVALMLHLASHVMLQEMKTCATDGKWTPEAAATPTSSLDMAMKRFKLTKARFLKCAVQQDRLLQEYQRRAQSLVKLIQDVRTEGAKYDNLLKYVHQDEVSDEGDASAQKLHKVRSLWSAIDEMLSALKEDQRVMACVLKGDSDRYTLDGADIALKIPRVLLEKIERLPQQLSTGNVYEAGQLNLLSMLELMTHALHLLKDERSQVAGHAPLAHLRPQELQTKSGQAARVLEDLKVLRQKISKEEIPEVRNATRKLEVEWDRRWRDTLEDKPLASFLSDDPALCFLSPMAPLSFEPTSDATCSSSVFSRYAAKLPGEYKDPMQQQTECYSLGVSTVGPAQIERAASPVAGTLFLANTSIQDLLHTPSPPPRVPSSAPCRPIQQASEKMIHTGCKVAPTKNKAKIFDWECDNLASQFAEAIATTSPVDGKTKGLDLEALLCNLGGDPFATKKQLPRTPESLILDVKSSWRKAVEESSKVQTPNHGLISEGECVGTRPNPPSQTLGTPMSPFTFLNTTPSGITAAAAACPSSPASTTTPQKPWTSQASAPSRVSPGTEALHSRSGTGSSAIHFSLDDETLPGSDSLLSLSDENLDDYDDGGGGNLLLLPHVSAGPKEPWLAQSSHLDHRDDASFLGKGTPRCPLTRPAVLGLDGGWLVADAASPAAAPPGSDTLFTLDLEALESLTPPRQEYSLPKLVSFSPIDDL
ncbi:unnamed protein product [Merluccius merluccius]